MREKFVRQVLLNMVKQGHIRRQDKVIAVCAAHAEYNLFKELGFESVTLSNLNSEEIAGDFLPFSYSREDARHLSHADKTFDFAFVSDGLHHCDSPHAALLEMYRVSSKGIIVFESRDSILVRLACKMGFSGDFEVEAVHDNDGIMGGMNNSQIPNYVYRWTEREFEKALSSFDPLGRIKFNYHYALSLPVERAQMRPSPLAGFVMRAFEQLGKNIAERLLGKQCNSFAMIAFRPDYQSDLWPWLEKRDGNIQYNRKYGNGIFSRQL